MKKIFILSILMAVFAAGGPGLNQVARAATVFSTEQLQQRTITFAIEKPGSLWTDVYLAKGTTYDLAEIDLSLLDAQTNRVLKSQKVPNKDATGSYTINILCPASTQIKAEAAFVLKARKNDAYGSGSDTSLNYYHNFGTAAKGAFDMRTAGRPIRIFTGATYQASNIELKFNGVAGILQTKDPIIEDIAKDKITGLGHIWFGFMTRAQVAANVKPPFVIAEPGAQNEWDLFNDSSLHNVYNYYRQDGEYTFEVMLEYTSGTKIGCHSPIFADFGSTPKVTLNFKDTGRKLIVDVETTCQ